MRNQPSGRIFGAVFTCAALATGLAISAALVGSLVSQASSTPTPMGTPEIEVSTYDMYPPPTDEGRSMYGDVFIGEVVAATGKERVPSSDPDFFTTAYFYDVEVDETLRGDASGTVRVRLYGADFASPDLPGARELRVGERLLFAGGYISDEGYYSVAAGAGTVPIANETDEASLVSTIEPLIRRDMQRADGAPPFDPCEEPEKSPTITADVLQGTTGDEVRLTGGPFIRPEAAVWWDGKRKLLAAAPVETDCTMDFEVSIPNARPGQHRIIVEDAGGNEAVVAFEIVE